MKQKRKNKLVKKHNHFLWFFSVIIFLNLFVLSFIFLGVKSVWGAGNPPVIQEDVDSYTKLLIHSDTTDGSTTFIGKYPVCRTV